MQKLYQRDRNLLVLENTQNLQKILPAEDESKLQSTRRDANVKSEKNQSKGIPEQRVL